MEPREREDMHKAGHYEAHGETIAKFEFFDNGFNPYSRYLDVDKVDLILRKRIGSKIQYFEIQVKYGRLYDCGVKWQQQLFDYVSFRFFKPDEFIEAHKDFFIAYVLVHPSEGYQKDIFIFPGRVFNALINQAISTKDGTSYKFHIARHKLTGRWYLWTSSKFDVIEGHTIDVTDYRRNFDLIKP